MTLVAAKMTLVCRCKKTLTNIVIAIALLLLLVVNGSSSSM